MSLMTWRSCSLFGMGTILEVLGIESTPMRKKTLQLLKNKFAADSAATEEPFIDVVSKAKKKKVQKGFQVHNTRSTGKIQ